VRRGRQGNDLCTTSEGNAVRTHDLRQDDTATEMVDAVRTMLADPRRTRR